MPKDKRVEPKHKAMHDHVAKRRRDKEFKARLERSMKDHRDILDRLSK